MYPLSGLRTRVLLAQLYFSSDAGGSVVCRRAEALEQTYGSEDGEGQEANEDEQERYGPGRAVRMKIGMDGVVNGKEHDREQSAAEPGEIVVQEIHRLGVTFRRQPVAFVRKIDVLRRQYHDQARDTESDHSGKSTYSNQKTEKGGFGLPAVRHAARVEVRSHYFRQLRVQGRKIKSRAHREHKEHEFGQPRTQAILFPSA